MVVMNYDGHHFNLENGDEVHTQARLPSEYTPSTITLAITVHMPDGPHTVTAFLTPTEAFKIGLALLRDYSLQTIGSG